MPISADAIQSPGWWALRLTRQLQDKKRIERLDLMDSFLRGEPPVPVPVAAPKLREAYRAVMRRSRVNFADLIVSACRERMIPIGFRTSQDDDETGDSEAYRIWQRAGLDVESVDVHRAMLGLSESYVIVGNIDPVTKVPDITFEDPRQVITASDPIHRNRVMAAIKVFYDDVAEVTRAYLYLPGRVYAARTSETGKRPVPFSLRSWEWDTERGGANGLPLPHDEVPVVKFENYAGLGEFEPHIDLLERINHQILQRLVIATMQAFRQRAIKGLPEKNADGEEIDYSNMFAADPGSLWQVPEGVEFDDFAQADLTPILSAVERDIQMLAAVSRTPMHMLQPGGVNESAEGAATKKEALIFRVEDRIVRASQGWSKVMSLAFRVMGDEQRADLDKLQVLWASTERRSLAEKADAAVKLAGLLPWRTLMIDVLDYPADQVDRMAAERIADQLQQQVLNPAPVEAEEPEGAEDGDQGQPE